MRNRARRGLPDVVRRRQGRVYASFCCARETVPDVVGARRGQTSSGSGLRGSGSSKARTWLEPGIYLATPCGRGSKGSWMNASSETVPDVARRRQARLRASTRVRVFESTDVVRSGDLPGHSLRSWFEALVVRIGIYLATPCGRRSKRGRGSMLALVRNGRRKMARYAGPFGG